MAKQETSPAAANVQARVVTREESQAASRPTTAPERLDFSNRDVLSENETEARTNSVLKDLYREYYVRGINIMKPEIVLSSEFIPIKNNSDPSDNVGLNIAIGTESVSVNQVIKLLELHRSVQESVNIASTEFIDETAGFNCVEVIEEMRGHYTSAVLKSSFDSTVDEFLDHLSSNLIDEHATIPATDFGTSRSAAAIIAGVRTGGLSDFGLVKYTSFRSMLQSGTEIQKGSLRALAEIIILEKVLIGMTKYFSKLNWLKQVIYELLYFGSMKSGSDDIGSNLSSTLKKYFRALEHNYNEIREPQNSQTGTIPLYGVDAEQVLITVSVEEGDDEPRGSSSVKAKSSDYIDSENLAVKGLGAKSIASAESNTLVLYSLFHRVLSLLNFNFPTYGKFDEEEIKDSASALEDRVMISYNLKQSDETALKEQLAAFSEIGVSSFFNGTILKETNALGDDNGWYYDYDKNYLYTSSRATWETEQKNYYERGFVEPWQQDLEERQSIGLSNSSSNRSKIINTTGQNKDKLSSLAELFAVSLFDVIIDINTKAYGSTNAFGLTAMRTSTDGFIEAYGRRVLGEYAELGEDSGGSYTCDNFSDVVYGYAGGATGNQNSTTPKPRVAGILGKFFDVCYGNYKVLDSKTGMLPSETMYTPSLSRTLPGNIGIISEAFINNNFDSLNEYIAKLEEFTENFSKDILRMSSLGVRDGFSNSSSDMHVRGAKTGIESTGAYARRFMEQIGRSLESDIKLSMQMKSLDTDSDVKLAQGYFPITLAYILMSGEDSSLGNKALTNFFAIYHYQNILKNRHQYDCGNVYAKKWFQRASYDALNRSIYHFRDTLGIDPNHIGRANNSEGKTFLGQYNDILHYQTTNETSEKGGFLWKDKLSSSETTSILGSETTKSIFDASVAKSDNAENCVFATPIGQINDAWTDTFQPQGLADDSDIDRTHDFNGGNLASTLHGPLYNFKVKIMNKADNYLNKKFQANTASTLWVDYLGELDDEAPGDFSPSPNNAQRRSKKTFFYATIVKEDIAKTDGPFKTNESQRDFAMFSIICTVLQKCCNLKVGWSKSGFTWTIDKYQMQGVVDALQNRQKRLPNRLDSYPSGASDRNDTLIENNKDAGLDDEYDSPCYISYSESYDLCMGAMKEALAPIYDRENAMRISLTAIYKHIASLNKVKNEVSSATTLADQSKKIKLAIDYADSVTHEAQSASSDEPIQDIKSKLIRYVTGDSTATMYKNAIELGVESSNRPLFSPNKTISEEQIHLMAIALSGIQDSGLSSEEKMGKKSIVSVGIPPNLLDGLQMNALFGNKDIDYYGSPYICIHIFKKDSLGGSLKYYPKPFIFNSNLINVENFNSDFADEADHITNASSISTYDQLLENFSMYKVDNSLGMLRKISGLSAMLEDPLDLEYMNDSHADFISNSDGTLRGLALEEMRTNHILDHYLKMYQRLSTGIDMGEYVFPLDSENKITGKVDASRANLFASYRNDLILRYPSINVDPVLAREFIRLEKNIKKSNFFSIHNKVKSILSPKAFSRIYSMFINESDYVVYPYPSHFDSFDLSPPGETADIIESLSELYQPGVVFRLGPGKQINGINSKAKNDLLFNSFVNGVYAGMVGNSEASQAFKLASGRTNSILRHIEDVETENIPDVYELFAVVSVLRKK